jgi:hypothetical protein
MLKKTVMAAVLILGASSFAMAQTTPSTPGTSSGAAMSGKMTEAQIKQKLTQQGYSDIDLKPASSRSAAGSGSTTSGSGSTTGGARPGGATTAANEAWSGTAMKGGKKVNIEVDATGKVTER